MALNIKQITNFSDVIKNAPKEKIDGKEYYVLNLGHVVKFGYICEQKGLHFPIYLKMDNDFVKFNIGKTGMLEVASDVGITGIKVPKKVSFTVDYVIDGE